MKISRETDLKRTARGFRRFVGNERFDLGHDRPAAENRRDAILALWDANCRELGFNNGPFQPADRKPYWLPHNLAAAHAIRKGIPPAIEPRFADPETYLDRIESLSELTGIEFTASDRRLADAGLNARRATVINAIAAVKKHTGQGLFQALDAYGEAIKTEYRVAGQITDHGRTKLDRIRIIKAYCADCDLGQLDLQACDALYASFRNRPNTKRYNKPMSIKFAADMVNDLRNFLEWLHLSKEFIWRKPEDFESLKKRPKSIDADANKQLDVPTWKLSELKTIFEYATPLDRVFFLLALNCAYGADQLGRLRISETKNVKSIDRVRRKKLIRVKHRLWELTQKAIEWYLGRRPNHADDTNADLLLITRHGKSYYRQSKGGARSQDIPNKWRQLIERIKRQEGLQDFRYLPFNSLRDTSINLIRRISGGEIAAVHASHKHHSTDRNLLAYSNPNRKKHSRAIRRFERKMVNVVFNSIVEPFPADQQQAATTGGRDLAPSKVRKIRAMKDAGFKTFKIAEEVGCSRRLVWKYLKTKQK